ncbi:MAG: hypothetical protein IPG44_17280 [Anaerolineales bacterium]|nr:hypothetical protein [Anaerolineales bacterium]
MMSGSEGENQTGLKETINPVFRDPYFYFATITIILPLISTLQRWNERNVFDWLLNLALVAGGAFLLTFVWKENNDQIAVKTLPRKYWSLYMQYRKISFPITGIIVYLVFFFPLRLIPDPSPPMFLGDPSATPVVNETQRTPVQLITPTKLTITPTISPTIPPTLTPTPSVKLERIIEWDFTNDLSGNKNYFLVTENCNFSHLPCWTDSPQGNYLDSYVYILKSYPIDLAGDWEHIYLFFTSKSVTESCCDKVKVFVDEDAIWEKSGYQDWQQNQTSNLIPKYKNKMIQIRFELSSDSGNNADGWYIQNVKLVFIAP